MTNLAWISSDRLPSLGRTLIAYGGLTTTYFVIIDDTGSIIVNETLIASMRPGSYIVNTARGGIIDEAALYKFAKSNHIAGVALDVYKQEPYNGPLAELDNCLLTAHIGSSTEEVRAIMEEQVVEDVIRFIKKQPLLRPLTGFNFCG